MSFFDYQDLRFENTIVKSTVFQSRLFESCRYFSTEIPEPQTHSTTIKHFPDPLFNNRLENG